MVFLELKLYIYNICVDCYSQVDALNSCIEELEQEIESLHETNQKLQAELESKPGVEHVDSSDAKDLLTIQNSLKEEKHKHQALLDR